MIQKNILLGISVIIAGIMFIVLFSLIENVYADSNSFYGDKDEITHYDYQGRIIPDNAYGNRLQVCMDLVIDHIMPPTDCPKWVLTEEFNIGLTKYMQKQIDEQNEYIDKKFEELRRH